MKKIFVGLLAAAICSTSNAEWKTIGWSGGDKQKPVIAVDMSRSFFDNGISYIWWKDFSYGFLTIVKRPENHSMSIYRTAIDCRARKVRNEYIQPVEVKKFDDANPAIYDPSWNGPGEWYVPDMNSSHEFILKSVCSIK